MKSKKSKDTLILGAGVTGLSAGLTLKAPVYEASREPGGLCRSYFVESGSGKQCVGPSASKQLYRFERAGGHWIFGADEAVLNFLEPYGVLKTYKKKSSVFFPKTERLVPYPIQQHLKFLAPLAAKRPMDEGIPRDSCREAQNLKEWLKIRFGSALFKLFFDRFHRAYTAGLYNRIAPADAYKSPAKGVPPRSRLTGYNNRFCYPVNGLGRLIAEMAKKADVIYGKKAVRIDRDTKRVYFADGTKQPYEKIISTIPLDQMTAMCGLKKFLPKQDPYTSVLVTNLGVIKGEHCPSDHWIYMADSTLGFYRIGFYSNVDESFLPRSVRGRGTHTSLYIERAFLSAQKPAPDQITRYEERLIRQLIKWKFIKAADVIDSQWIETAYTWSWPGSDWVGRATEHLAREQIHSIGRFGSWKFQGISDCIRQGWAGHFEASLKADKS